MSTKELQNVDGSDGDYDKGNGSKKYILILKLFDFRGVMKADMVVVERVCGFTRSWHYVTFHYNDVIMNAMRL